MSSTPTHVGDGHANHHGHGHAHTMTPEQRSRARRAVFTAALGKALEWFGIIVYAFMAPVSRACSPPPRASGSRR